MTKPAFKFKCGSCEEEHEGIPTFGADAPESYDRIPEADRAARAELSSDPCIIDGKSFFVRGCLEIPVAGLDEPFVWGVWVSLSESSFARMSELWETKGRESEPPYFGWLNTLLPGYPTTLSLKTHVHTRRLGERPSIELEPTDHPLAVEQRQGIDLKRLTEIVERTLHPWPPEPCASVLRAVRERWGEEDRAIVFDETGRAAGSTPPLRRTEVWIWDASGDDDVTSFVTIGMSSRPLPLQASHRAE